MKSRHTMEADLPRHVGGGGDADTMHMKADVTFDYVPPIAGGTPSLELVNVVTRKDDRWWTPLKAWRAASEWLSEAGYDSACGFAEARRPLDPDELAIEE